MSTSFIMGIIFGIAALVLIVSAFASGISMDFNFDFMDGEHEHNAVISRSWLCSLRTPEACSHGSARMI